jgi:hypothetical protein
MVRNIFAGLADASELAMMLKASPGFIQGNLGSNII